MSAKRPSLVCTAGLVLAALLAGCGAAEPSTATESAQVSTSAPIGDGATPKAVDGEGEHTATPSGTPSTPPPADATQADRAAGVLQAQVPDSGDGEFTTAPGAAPAPDPAARTRTVAVQVENGLPADTEAAADFVLGTLNDPRGWHTQGFSFARTDDTAQADIIVVLASPQTSADMCRPLITGGKLSCREGRRAILTWYRWVNGHQDYGDDLTGYRHYVVNHEVGHALGRSHVGCPGAGRPAPVMMQQTKGLKPCTPNPWVEPGA